MPASLPRRLVLEDINELTVLLNALELLADNLDDDDEDLAVITRLTNKLEA